MLEDAGYKTPTATASARCRRWQAAELHLLRALDGEDRAEISEFVTGWLDEIGIATTKKTADDGQLTTIIGKGDYDMFAWGWTPFVDPDLMLSHFTCDQVSSDPEDPSNYNDANYCDPQYDKLYQQQKVELDRDKREQIVHEMLTRFQQSGTYHAYTEPELQAYLKGRFEGFVRQPAKIGPVVYQQTRRPTPRWKSASASSGGDDGGGSGVIIVIIAVVVLGVAARCSSCLRRRRTVAERESARFIGGVGVAGDPALRRPLQLLPVPGRRDGSGRELPRLQPDLQTQRAKLTEEFGLDKSTGAQFVAYLKETATLNLGRSYIDQPVPVWEEIKDKAGPTIALVGVSAVLSGVFGMLGVAAAAKIDEGRLLDHGLHDGDLLLMPEFWLGMILLTVFAVALAGSRSAGSRTRP